LQLAPGIDDEVSPFEPARRNAVHECRGNKDRRGPTDQQRYSAVSGAGVDHGIGGKAQIDARFIRPTLLQARRLTGMKDHTRVP
jgi:hypothetical protein